MKNSDVEASSADLPIAFALGETPIGGARVIEDEGMGAFRFEGLDFLARVFFAERIGPGGPGEDITLCDLQVTDQAGRRTLRATTVTVQHFSSGEGDLELRGAFGQIDR